MPPPVLSPPQNALSWLDRFEPFGLFHLVSVAACIAVMIAWSLVGRRLMATSVEAERRFRVRVALGIIAWQSFATAWRLLPMNYSIEESWPLHLCRVVGWVVPFMLITQHRRLRAIVYFWGIGLSTQGFFTPMWDDGLASVGYWLFWVGHTIIVGAGVYDIAVHGWGPRFRDWGFASLWGLIFAVVVMSLNLVIGTNYNYLGKGKYESSSVVDLFGEWPQRPALIVLSAAIIYLTLYLAALAVRWKKSRSPVRRGPVAPAPEHDPRP